MEIGLSLVKGLLYMISVGLSVMVCVSVIWCVMLLEILVGLSDVVLCRFMVLSFMSIRLWMSVLFRLVCLCSGKVMLLNIVMLVKSVLFWNSMFIL